MKPKKTTSKRATKILLIRHAEKLAKDSAPYGVTADGERSKESLAIRGWQRAGALADLLVPSDGHLQHVSLAQPQFLYASKPLRRKGSRRPIETITPLAEKLAIRLNSNFPRNEYESMLDEVFLCEGIVLICWQREYIPEIGSYILGDNKIVPQNWPEVCFDIIWVFDLNPSLNQYTFQQVPQKLLAGDLASPIKLVRAKKVPMFDADFISNPYRIYNYLRATAPLHWADKFRTGAWLVPRYADVLAGLHDPRLSSQRSHNLTAALPTEMQGEFSIFNQIFSRWMLFLDPPHHSRLRKLLNKEFTPNMIQRMRPRIQQAVNTLLDQVAGKAEMEFMSEFANPLPVIVIAEMLGIPSEDQKDFQIWSDDLADFFGNSTGTVEAARRAQDSLISLTEYFRALLPERRAHKGDDLVSLLLRVEEEGEVLTGEELLAQCTLLLVAGHETTRNLLGNGLLALLQHPDQFARLRQDPSLMPLAVREFARYDSPVQFSGRAATEDFSWHDKEIKKGQTVLLLLGSANHDPEKFSNPARLEISRDEGMPLSFGHGTHFCIGAALAQAEAEIAFTILLERTSNLTMLDDGPAWRPNLSFRGLSRLRLTIGV